MQKFTFQATETITLLCDVHADSLEDALRFVQEGEGTITEVDGTGITPTKYLLDGEWVDVPQAEPALTAWQAKLREEWVEWGTANEIDPTPRSLALQPLEEDNYIFDPQTANRPAFVPPRSTPRSLALQTLEVLRRTPGFATSRVAKMTEDEFVAEFSALLNTASRRVEDWSDEDEFNEFQEQYPGEDD